mmetsp:Transcript_44787/g.128511  ORF Transcript_44787/g.128511 Transcript_44787/m.128511 type:complete len:151 (+) Transcript_44787:140-592(+)
MAAVGGMRSTGIVAKPIQDALGQGWVAVNSAFGKLTKNSHLFGSHDELELMFDRMRRNLALIQVFLKYWCLASLVTATPTSVDGIVGLLPDVVRASMMGADQQAKQTMMAALSNICSAFAIWDAVHMEEDSEAESWPEPWTKTIAPSTWC